MKKFILLITVFLFSTSVLAQDVYISFITTNDYGNNLYIDNINVGSRFNNDVAVVSINNIKRDTSYNIGSDPFGITPRVSVVNTGLNNITTPFDVTLSVSPGGYSSTKSVASLNSGALQEVLFDELTITPGIAITINVITSLAGDEYSNNDNLAQFSIVYPGVQRNVLLEEWTSATCGPCASNNPTVDGFITTNFSSVSAIKYHVGWPSPGNDPMYLHNPTQSYDRRYYYAVNAAPTVIIDGVVNPVYPYTTSGSLQNAYNSRINIGSPLSVEVTDTRITGDSIQADINVIVSSPLMFGNYFLRVHAIERKIQYASPPGTNGETIFYDVFRRAFPNSTGIQIPTTVGTHSFIVKYPVDRDVWVDSMIYTTAFVQNDLTKEIINSGKAREFTKETITPASDFQIEKQSMISDNLIIKDQEIISAAERSVGNFYYELFESDFPPVNWRIVNPDGGITFQQFTGANGNMFGGSKSVKFDFYSYGAEGQTDTMYAGPFTGLLQADSVKFDYAYAQYPNYSDRLVVKISKDGGHTYPYTIFDKAGSNLATAPQTQNPFVPTSNQWNTFSYSLQTIVPVELTSFSAKTAKEGIHLNWTTATELNNYGFEIQRSFDGDNFVTIGFVNGYGTTSDKQNYSYTDKPGINKKINLFYRLKQVDFNGDFKFSNMVNVVFDLPNEFSLLQNYPNPFNPTTKITYLIADNVPVTIKVYDISGQEVVTLVNEVKEAGSYDIVFNSSSLSSGVYFVKMNAGEFNSVKKMNILK